MILLCLKIPARFNFSHGDHEGHGAVLARLRKVAREKKRNIAVLLDTKGPEIRSGFFANDVKKISLVKGETLVLTADYNFKGDNTKLACSYPQIATSVKPGQQILVADGSLVLTVMECHADKKEVVCRIENNASIGERKNMNLPGTSNALLPFLDNCYSICIDVCFLCIKCIYVLIYFPFSTSRCRGGPSYLHGKGL